jgi:hypothetical protein
MGVTRMYSGAGQTEKSAYKLTFKPFTNIFTEHPKVVGFCTGISVWEISFFFEI